jgi:hypothetical protein
MVLTVMKLFVYSTLISIHKLISSAEIIDSSIYSVVKLGLDYPVAAVDQSDQKYSNIIGRFKIQIAEANSERIAPADRRTLKHAFPLLKRRLS